MLSTVMELGSIVALIGGVSYFTFQYMPTIIDFWNQLQNTYLPELTSVVPDWVQPFIAMGALFSGVGLLIKLL